MNVQIQQIKRLSWFLLASVSLNACMISLIFYTNLVERPPQPVFESQQAVIEAKPLATHGEISLAMTALKSLTIEELLSQIHDKRVVENGFTLGDLSVAVLAGYYYFDVERAVSRPVEKIVVSFGQRGESLVVYPDLLDEDFLALEKFRRGEKWPFRAQGLFNLLKREKYKNETSLQETFFLTPEFLSLELLLSRAGIKIEKTEILELALSQDWGFLAAFYEKQRMSLDLSEGARRLLLLATIDNESVMGAHLLLKTDYEFALKKLEDRVTIKVLNLLKTTPEIASSFAKELLKSPRAEKVRQAAIVYAPQEFIVPVIESSSIAVISKPVQVVPKASSQQLEKIAGTKLDVKKEIKEVVKNTSLPPKIEKLVVKEEAKKIIKITQAQESSKVGFNKSPAKPTLPQLKEKIYIVQKNETLQKIALKFNLDLDLLKKMNGITNEELKPGRPLRIPDHSLPSTRARI